MWSFLLNSSTEASFRAFLRRSLVVSYRELPPIRLHAKQLGEQDVIVVAWQFATPRALIDLGLLALAQAEETT